MTDRPFSDRQARYAAWRESLRSGSRIDLTQPAEPEPLSAWSSDVLFAEPEEAPAAANAES